MLLRGEQTVSDTVLAAAGQVYELRAIGAKRFAPADPVEGLLALNAASRGRRPGMSGWQVGHGEAWSQLVRGYRPREPAAWRARMPGKNGGCRVWGQEVL
jgi:hypothetical protein